MARLVHVLIISLAFAARGAEDESAFLKNVRQLTFEGKRSGEGYFSPDGKSLIFQSEREPDNPFYQIYILDLEAGETHRVSPGIGKTTCAFFRPNSDEVLFASTHHDPEARAKQKAELEFRASGKERRYSWDYDDKMDIFSCKRDGTGLKRLTDAPGYDAEGAYSPDGTKIVFCSLRHAPPGAVDPSAFGEIYIMNADGSGQRRLTSTPGYDGGPFFSPDGQRIIWRRFDEKGLTADVYTMKLDGSDVRRLTDFGAMSWAPYYHPSGKYVIFTSNKLGFSNFELYLVDAQGGQPTRVTHTDGFDGLPVFSPDGKKLCWTSSRTSDGKSQLFFADWVYKNVAQASPPAGSSGVSRQFSSEIAVDDLKHQVAFLASDELEGRMTGSKGSQRAADYIADYLRSVGVSPAFQKFEFTAGVRVITNKNHLVVNGSAFDVEKDFRPLSLTENNQVEGDVVFVGYGLKVPGKEGYDSYSGLNVSNKIVVALRYVPEDVTAERRQELNRYAALRYKAMLAREHGAKAVLFVTGPNSPNPGELAGLNFDSTQAGSGIVAASISSNVARAILPDLKSAQTALDKEDPHTPGGFALTNVTVKISTAVERVRKEDRNVLGFLPPSGSAGTPRPANNEYIIVGGHYDHLGFGESGAMLRKGEENQIHNGADDNASGIAAIMELAGTLAKVPDRQRGVLFAFWSGEEIGLVGSSYFAEHPTLPLSNTVAYLNFDMVGRLKDNKLLLQGIGSSAAWKRLIEKRNVAAGFNTVLQDDPYLPTDTTAFYPKGVPVLSFFTGSHDDYHRPTDDADKLDYEGLLRITKFASGIISDLLKTPERLDYVKVERSSSGGSRENLRAYLGTIPDYATEVAGVKISGVRGGSPADKGGLKGGDVIVEFAGQKIANIYDYTYALDAVKIGQPIMVAVMREGKRVLLNVTPEARK
jgi:Tol biopolymer transport system component